MIFLKGRKVDLENTRVFVFYDKKRKNFLARALEGKHKGKIVLEFSNATIEAVLFTSEEINSETFSASKYDTNEKLYGVAGYIKSLEAKDTEGLQEIHYSKNKDNFYSLVEGLESIIHYSNSVYLEENKYFI